jgi:hypothetical protein
MQRILGNGQIDAIEESDHHTKGEQERNPPAPPGNTGKSQIWLWQTHSLAVSIGARALKDFRIDLPETAP